MALTTPERALWNKVRDGMGHRWHPQRHEDKYSVGIPDVSFGMKSVNGWIELKVVPTAPRDGYALGFDIKKLSDDQRNWLNARAAHGGWAGLFVLTLVANKQQYLLHHWYNLRQRLGVGSYRDFVDCAAAGWIKGIHWGDFEAVLMERIHGNT